jgi:hypothetical protein
VRTGPALARARMSRQLRLGRHYQGVLCAEVRHLTRERPGPHPPASAILAGRTGTPPGPRAPLAPAVRQELAQAG